MKQHIVSKCYLKAWCDPSTPKAHEPYVWLISRDGASKVKRAPHKSLTKTDAYTLTFNDGKKDLRVETTLSQLEGKFVRVQQKIVEHKSLDPYDRAYLAAFMATMHSRTDPMAEGMKESMSQLDSLVKKMEEVIRRGDAAKLPPMISPGEGAPISSADTEYLVRNARPLVVEGALDAAAPIMWRMPLAFLQAPEGSFFVTSDNPCVWFDPAAYKRHPFYRNPGLAMKDVEITMPIAPGVLALQTHNPSVQGYKHLTVAQVDELNRRTVGFCDKLFVSISPETRPMWFDPGTPPADAWENRVKEEEPRRSPFDPSP
jgi:hypothetical protein